MFNNSNLYGSEWLAVVFSNRNKNYGAYALRAQSDNNTMRALFIAAPVFIMLFVGPVLYGKLHKKDLGPALYDHPVTIAPDIIHEQKKVEPKKPEAEKAKPVVQEKLKSIAFTAPVVVADPPNDPPTTDEVNKSIISTVVQDGKEGKDNLPTTINTGTPTTGVVGGTGIVDNEIKDVAGVDVYPEFPGGMAAWAKYIQKNLHYPYTAQEENIQGKVFLSFVVEKDGSITDVKIVKGIGYGCDDEAKRVIQKSPRWNAGKQNNQSVRVRYNMPISYTLSN